MIKSPGYKVQSKKITVKKWNTDRSYTTANDALILAYALHSVTRLQVRVITDKKHILYQN